MTNRRRFRPTLAATASSLGVLMVVLLVAFAFLTAVDRDPQNGWVPNAPWIAMAFVFATVGVVLARRRPDNSIGWILIAAGLVFMLITALSAYLVLDFRVDHQQLPLGSVLIWISPIGLTSFLFIGLPILLFPDGHAPSRAWRWSMWAYLLIGAASLACSSVAGVIATTGHPLRINAQGNLTALQHPSGSAVLLNSLSSLALLVLVPILVLWVVRLAMSFRRSRGEQRQQLKWLLGGAGITALAIVFFVAGSALGGGDGSGSGVLADLLEGGLTLAIAAFPIGLAVGILKYRLYDIDRILSRTLAYAVVTGLLIGLYLGLVTLATRVLPFTSPIGVAGSTLIAAALFNPLRRRIQRLVDRRFNRTRYDAEATISAFARRVRDDVDLQVVTTEFVRAVQGSVEPTHMSLWLRGPGAEPG